MNSTRIIRDKALTLSISFHLFRFEQQQEPEQRIGHTFVSVSK